MEKLASLLLSGALALDLLAGCGGAPGTADTPAANTDTPATPAQTGSLEGTTLKMGASPAPHTEILAVVKELLAEEGINLEIVEFTGYIQPNTAVENGSVDTNYFQHITYLDNLNTENGTHLVSVADAHYEPFSIYTGKTASLEESRDGAQIGVSNDPTNSDHALLLLQEQGFVTLKEDVGLEPAKLDIAENPHNYEIVEMEATQLPRSLGSLDIAVINGNYAIQADLRVADALAIESAEGTAGTACVSVLAAKGGREGDPAIQALAEALCSDEVRAFIDKTYAGAVQTVFQGPVHADGPRSGPSHSTKILLTLQEFGGILLDRI